MADQNEVVTRIAHGLSQASEMEKAVERKQARIKVGEYGTAVMPHSEVCMHMKVAGKRMTFQVVSERSVQLFDENGNVFSFPILLGEAGIYTDEQGMYFYGLHE